MGQGVDPPNEIYREDLYLKAMRGSQTPLNSDCWSPDEMVTGELAEYERNPSERESYPYHKVVSRRKRSLNSSERIPWVFRAATLLPRTSDITMSVAIYNRETYPGRSFSVSQLLYAAKRKLQETAFCGRYVWNRNRCTSNDSNIALQDCNDRKPKRGETKRRGLSIYAWWLICVVFR